MNRSPRAVPVPRAGVPLPAGGFPAQPGTGAVARAAGNPHGCRIASTALGALSALSPRRHPAWTAAAGLLVAAASVTVIVVAMLQTKAAPAGFHDGLVTSISYAVPYGITGAFLIARRPDLPFGWLLSGAAMLAAAGSASAAAAYLAVSHGGSRLLAIAGFASSATFILPLAVQGLVNVRFPSGHLSSRGGRALE